MCIRDRPDEARLRPGGSGSLFLEIAKFIGPKNSAEETGPSPNFRGWPAKLRKKWDAVGRFPDAVETQRLNSVSIASQVGKFASAS